MKIPAIAPMALKVIVVNENIEAPQSEGIIPPILDPINIPIHIADFPIL